jgi:hypothetical protein
MKKKISKFKCNKVSVNNFGVSPSASNPGDVLRSSSVVVSSKGKKPNQTKPNKTTHTQKKTPQSVSSSNAVQFQ